MAPLAERDIEAEKPVVLGEHPHPHVAKPQVVPRDGRASLVDAMGMEQPAAAGSGDGTWGWDQGPVPVSYIITRLLV